MTLRRSIGYVIQQIGLFPNKTIEENICVVPDLLGWDRGSRRARAADLLTLVNLDPGTFLKRYPKELSGGQQQRVGVVRALAADPPVLLMDEPFGAIDPINREVIQDEFMKLQAELKKTDGLRQPRHRRGGEDGLADRHLPRRPPDPVRHARHDPGATRSTRSWPSFVGGDRTLKRLRLIKVADAMMSDPPRVIARGSVGNRGRANEEHGHISIVMVGPRGRARGMIRLDQARGRRGRQRACRAAARRRQHQGRPAQRGLDDVHATASPGSPASTTTASTRAT